uniref:Uncharacterized protein n=1 Tax=Trichogramma kaykai TaxID=54128 RepID=A0ABD2WGU0_9HYME
MTLILFKLTELYTLLQLFKYCIIQNICFKKLTRNFRNFPYLVKICSTLFNDFDQFLVLYDKNKFKKISNGKHKNLIDYLFTEVTKWFQKLLLFNVIIVMNLQT